jgi:CRISPR system Cascade subunit CasE
MPDPLWLVKVPLLADRLGQIARRKHMPLRDLDEGYLCHCVMRDAWGEAAPSPFVLCSRGRIIEAWGYSRWPAEALVEQARRQPDATALSAIADLDAVASKAVPALRPGQQVGFLLRACPVVRLSTAIAGHQAGAEVDAFLARCFREGPEIPVHRQEVYRQWLAGRLGGADSGATLDVVRVDATVRERMVRRTHGAERSARHIERPDVRFSGTLIVTDPAALVGTLAKGVGRHRAFGFGALLLVPPGSEWSR